jgi:glutathione S-transferase
MLTLYYHPLASYCWKVLIALYESGTPFERRIIDLGDPAQRAELSALWPLCKFPTVRDGERIVVESSIIVEHLDRHHPGPRPLVPRDAGAALEARLWDRLCDNYGQTPVQEIVFDRLRGGRDDMSRPRATLVTFYKMVEQQLGASQWIVGADFGLADCAAAPALFYGQTLEPFPGDCGRLRAYFDRLIERPSVRRTLDEAKPYFESYPFERAIPARFR